MTSITSSSIDFVISLRACRLLSQKNVAKQKMTKKNVSVIDFIKQVNPVKPANIAKQVVLTAVMPLMQIVAFTACQPHYRWAPPNRCALKF